MEEWLMLGERQERGLTFEIGMAPEGGAVYRWERLTWKPAGAELQSIQQTLAIRERVLSGMAILPGSGLRYLQKRPVIGWPLRQGGNLFEHPMVERPPEQLIGAVLPLIHSYAQAHREGLCCGPPQWGRVDYDDQGVFLPDPWFHQYLFRPETQLPEGLAACRPPEELQGKGASPAGDCFYLGLLLYWVFTGKIPFRLHRNWPTRALVNGEVIPPTQYRPDLNPAIARNLILLLDPDPGKRPSAGEVERLYRERPDEDPIERRCYQQLVRSLRRETIGKRVKSGWLFAAGSLLLFGALVLIIINRTGRAEVPPAPSEYVQKFYQAVAGPGADLGGTDFPIFKDINELRKQRYLAVRQLVSKPLAEPEKVEIVSVTEGRAKVRVHLIWWEWTEQGWRNRRSREVLTLRRQGLEWRFQKRELTGEAPE